MLQNFYHTHHLFSCYALPGISTCKLATVKTFYLLSSTLYQLILLLGYSVLFGVFLIIDEYLNVSDEDTKIS